MLRLRPSKGALVALFLLASTGFAAAQELPAPRASTGYDKLPAAVRSWIETEQKLLSRKVDNARIYTPEENYQDARFAPESGNVFEVKSYWVDADKVSAFEGDGIPANLRSLFVRTEDGKKQVRFLVHPESETLYEQMLKEGAEPAPSFWATPTSSSRSMLAWLPGKESTPFFAKLSLNKQIGGVVRTIPLSEVSRSVGVNDVLARDQATAPKNFRFLPEVFGVMPKGMERGGMIVRDIPADLRSGAAKYIPLFSLYAEPQDGSPTILARMIKNSGEDPVSFVKKRIVDPLVDQWFDMVVDRGVQMEPHAQNVLIGVGADGLVAGNFLHRDLGGFTVDFNYRDKLGLPRPTDLPVINDFDKDHLERAEDRLRDLRVYFLGGFVYNLDQETPKWFAKGWLEGVAPAAEAFTRLFEDAVKTQLSLRLGQPVETAGDFQLVEATKKARAARENAVKLLQQAARPGDTMMPDLAAIKNRLGARAGAPESGFVTPLGEKLIDRVNEAERGVGSERDR